MKTKLIFLTSIIPTTFLIFSLINACAAQNVTNQPTTSDKPSGYPKPPSSDSSGSNNDSNVGSIEIPTEIITELPKENITENTSVLPFGKLTKYVLEIPKIKINNVSLTLEQQKQLYLDVIEYITGKRSDSDSVIGAPDTSFYGHANFLTLIPKNDQIFGPLFGRLGEYMQVGERIFYLDKEEWFESLEKRIGSADAALLSLFLPIYVHAKNMAQVAKFLASWSSMQIQMIDAKNQTGSAQAFFQKPKFLDAAQNALKALQLYFDPLTGQTAINSNDGLFFSDPLKTKITDNHWVYKMLVQVANQALSPLTFFLDNDNSFLETTPKHIRNSEEVFAKVAGEKVKYRKDFSQQELQAFWKKWFKTNKQIYNWQFEQE